MKKLINLKKINSLFFGIMAIFGFIALVFVPKNLFIRLLIVGSVLILWIISLMIALWKNNIFLNTENTDLNNQINNLKSDNSDLADKNKNLESDNRDLIESNETLKNNREGLKQQVMKDKVEFQTYDSQVTELQNANDKILRESTVIIGLMLDNSPTKDFLYKQIKSIQTASLGNEIYNLDYFEQAFQPIIQTQEKLLEQELQKNGEKIENH